MRIDGDLTVLTSHLLAEGFAVHGYVSLMAHLSYVVPDRGLTRHPLPSFIYQWKNSLHWGTCQATCPRVQSPPAREKTE